MRWPVAAILLAGTAFAGGWPATMDGFRHEWGLTPARSPRLGVWDCRRLSDGTLRVLAFADSSSGRSLRSVDWWAESGARDVDLPDETFWAVLDGLSDGKEWTESDPEALDDAFRSGLEGPAAQGFLCRSCSLRLEAATWVSHGSTRLRVSRIAGASRHAAAAGLSRGLTDAGIRSLAGQRGLGVVSANPCREGGGDCVLELSGPKGQRWIFRRSGGDSSWNTMEASWPGGPWWSPEWSWDSLRVESRRDFADLLEQWIGADADVAARNLLAPVEPALSFPVSAWFDRSLPGLRLHALADSLSRLPSPPPTLETARMPGLRAGIDGFGRRTFRVGPP